MQKISHVHLVVAQGQKFRLTKFSIFWSEFRLFGQNFDYLVKFSTFWLKFRLTKFSICWSKFRLTKFSIFNENYTRVVARQTILNYRYCIRYCIIWHKNYSLENARKNYKNWGQRIYPSANNDNLKNKYVHHMEKKNV